MREKLIFSYVLLRWNIPLDPYKYYHDCQFILIHCKSSKMAAHRGDQSHIRMSLLRCLLLLTVSAALCQAEAGCKVKKNDQHVDITCNEITDFSAVTSALTSEDQKVIQLKIIKSPQLVIQRADLDNPAFQELEQFHWTNSGKTSFDPAPFQGLAKLISLVISKNDLGSIAADTFTGLTNLQNLDLGENKIVSIEAGAFKLLQNLRRLILSFNLLTSIPSGLFEGSTVLMLDLNGNQLTSIEEGSLLGLDNLINLDLSDNKIKTIDSKAFQTLLHLNLVILGSNELEGIDSRLFANNPLAVLDLVNIHMENIKQFQLNSSSLLGLRLTRCFILSLPVDFFNNLPALTVLELGANNITSIAPALFSGLSNLQHLDLDANKLTSLSVSSFRQFHKLAKAAARNETHEINGNEIYSAIDMKDNPWDCSSSDMTELRAWCEHNDVVFDDLFNCDNNTATVLSA